MVSLNDASAPLWCVRSQWVRGGFREGDEDSNFSILRVRRFTESPEPLHWIAFPVEILTKPPIHWIASPLFTEKPFLSLKSASSHPLPKTRLRMRKKRKKTEENGKKTKKNGRENGRKTEKKRKANGRENGRERKENTERKKRKEKKEKIGKKTPFRQPPFPKNLLRQKIALKVIFIFWGLVYFLRLFFTLENNLKKCKKIAFSLSKITSKNNLRK